MIPGCGGCLLPFCPPYRSPCFLPCGHVFCLFCLRRLVDRWPCPLECRDHLIIIESEVQPLSLDFDTIYPKDDRTAFNQAVHSRALQGKVLRTTFILLGRGVQAVRSDLRSRLQDLLNLTKSLAEVTFYMESARFGVRCRKIELEGEIQNEYALRDRYNALRRRSSFCTAALRASVPTPQRHPSCH
ncbi:hypothetical protein FA13DRAFT_1798709 [Coprinellus micaceus]|uniref:RING-type domain-containing protein n=1 Tax=Coprinellus micaceus TaxID=71717 RepID=A0A4Y7SLY7_COPMI|nr:hypothetical protein FA13DRAFT_1798709 [Coprinellus micaceus]